MGNYDLYLRGLTQDQRNAVMQTEGRVRVIAGAGSGKTRTLVHRYAFLLNTVGIPQSDILCMTFTNKAAREMKDRISVLCPGGVAGDFVTTIHGFCVKFLREEIFRLGYPENYLIFDEEDMKTLIKEVLEENGIARRSGIVGEYLDELAAFKAAAPYIPRFVVPTAPLKPEETPVLGQMVLRQKRYFALDFDDLLFYTLHILNSFPEVRERWQRQFQYVMVDEVQDCDRFEWELFTILSGHYGNLFIVGDADQAIYEWKGAHPELFVNYAPDTDIYLKENFRSVPNIVAAADSIVANNHNRLPRTSVTMRPAGGSRTLFVHCRNEEAEAARLAAHFKALTRKGFGWKDMAVLYRATYLSRSIEQCFIREKIPYTIWGGVRFFERKEVKDALAYLRLAALDDDLSFKRIANVPSRKIGRQTMADLQAAAASRGCSLFQALRDSGLPRRNKAAARLVDAVGEARAGLDSESISATLEQLMAASGLLEMYRVDTEEDRLENLQELLSSVRLYEEQNRNEENLGVRTYLQDIALYTNADYRKDDDKVRLMTIHQAKGLEFPVVWIHGLSEGILPSHRTVRERGEAGLEEERRLMYVACTRAMDRLFFSDSEGFNVQNSLNKYPSRFIREAHDEMGPLYDVEGKVGDELWKGTDRMVAQTGVPGPATGNGPDLGSEVHHSVFGDGVVVDTDPGMGVVTVHFSEFGKRRINPALLELAGNIKKM